MTEEGTPDSASAEVRDLLSRAEDALRVAASCVRDMRKAVEAHGCEQQEGVPITPGRKECQAVNGRERTALSVEQVASLEPNDFDVFLDFVLYRFGGRMWKGQEGRLEESDLQPRDLYVLATLMERKGQPVPNAKLAGGQTAKVIGRLRKALGDTAKKQKVICTADKENWLAGWTGYLIRPEVKVCLVRRRRPGGGNAGPLPRAV